MDKVTKIDPPEQTASVPEEARSLCDQARLLEIAASYGRLQAALALRELRRMQ